MHVGSQLDSVLTCTTCSTCCVACYQHRSRLRSTSSCRTHHARHASLHNSRGQIAVVSDYSMTLKASDAVPATILTKLSIASPKHVLLAGSQQGLWHEAEKQYMRICSGSRKLVEALVFPHGSPPVPLAALSLAPGPLRRLTCLCRLGECT